jgi:hypothetical protein
MCPHTDTYVFVYCYICALILLHMCAYSAICESSYNLHLKNTRSFESGCHAYGCSNNAECGTHHIEWLLVFLFSATDSQSIT